MGLFPVLMRRWSAIVAISSPPARSAVAAVWRQSCRRADSTPAAFAFESRVCGAWSGRPHPDWASDGSCWRPARRAWAASRLYSRRARGARAAPWLWTRPRAWYRLRRARVETSMSSRLAAAFGDRANGSCVYDTNLSHRPCLPAIPGVGNTALVRSDDTDANALLV